MTAEIWQKKTERRRNIYENNIFGRSITVKCNAGINIKTEGGDNPES